MKTKSWTYLIAGLLILSITGILVLKMNKLHSAYKIGQPIDSLHGVYVYYNGEIDNVLELNETADKYLLGLKYQCVEFVKRYYYEHLNHKMPDAYGHAKDFYEIDLKDGRKSEKRNLTQYQNPSQTKPKVDDLLIFGETPTNEYGHVAIISDVTDRKIEIIQQNPGPSEKSRETYVLERLNDKWRIKNERILGWLRKE